MASEYTPNYNLDLYASEDKPNLRDQYNAAMGKIDTQLKANADGVTNMSASVVAATTAANEAKQIAQDAEAAAENAAPVNHASTEAIYGLGGALKYGHVSLAQTITNPTIAEDGIAASPKAVYQFVDNGYATKSHAAGSTQYGGATANSYGHVRLTDSAASVSTASQAIGASPLCVDNKISEKLAAEVTISNTNVTLNSGGFGGIVTYNLITVPEIGLNLLYLRSSGISHSGTTGSQQTLTTLPTANRPGTYHQCTIADQIVLIVESSGKVSVQSHGNNTGTGDIGCNLIYFTGE